MKNTTRKGNLSICIAEATAFFDVAKAFSAKLVSDLASIYTYPVVVNYAFSCELYLKALLMYRSTDGNHFLSGHSLKELLSSQLMADSKSIRELYKPEIAQWTFEDAIVEFDMAFEEWRYAFESRDHDIVSTVFELGRFAGVLRLYVEQTVGKSV